MENKEVKLGMKVVPFSKSYAQDLHNSSHWKLVKDSESPYLFVNYIHFSHTHGNVFVLGSQHVPNNCAHGDFFLAKDFEVYNKE